MTTDTLKRFRLGEYIKDDDLARAVRNELAGLQGEDLALAREAIAEVGASSIKGGYEQLLDAYKLAIQRALKPDRKIVKNPQIDRKIVRNPQLAAVLDKELVDVTADELAAVHTSLKAIFDEARNLAIEGTPGAVRYVTHEQSAICRAYGRHPTVPSEDKPPCGYFRSPEEWREVLRLEVRKALKR